MKGGAVEHAVGEQHQLGFIEALHALDEPASAAQGRLQALPPHAQAGVHHHHRRQGYVPPLEGDDLLHHALVPNLEVLPLQALGAGAVDRDVELLEGKVELQVDLDLLGGELIPSLRALPAVGHRQDLPRLALGTDVHRQPVGRSRDFPHQPAVDVELHPVHRLRGPGLRFQIDVAHRRLVRAGALDHDVDLFRGARLRSTRLLSARVRSAHGDRDRGSGHPGHPRRPEPTESATPVSHGDTSLSRISNRTPRYLWISTSSRPRNSRAVSRSNRP